jgi:RNA polymerase sigma factor (sigma-70 family)
VDEVIQETFWRVWQWTRGPRALLAPPAMLWHCWQWAVADVLRVWFGRRSAGTAHSAAARDSSRPGMSSIDDPDEVTHAWLAAIADADDVEVVVLQREARRTLHAALDDLPAQDRACVACRYLQSMSVQETATRLGLTIDQVKKHTSRGLRGLARIFLTRSFPR